MKKKSTKLVVRRETLRVLERLELDRAVGGVEPDDTAKAVCFAPAKIDNSERNC